MHYYVNLFKLNCRSPKQLDTKVGEIISQLRNEGISTQIKVFHHKTSMYVLPMDSKKETVEVLSKNYEDVSVWDEMYAPEGMTQKQWDKRKALLRVLMPTGNANDSGINYTI